MRPIRITGVTGTSTWVPLDTYSPAAAAMSLSGGGAAQYTLDNPFDTTITPVAVALTLTGGGALVPLGARAVRATGMAGADVLTVSQQGLS
jgi:hypothetical protein